MKKLLTTLGILIRLLSVAQEDTMKYIKYPTSQVQYGGIWAKTYLRIPDTARVNAKPGAIGINTLGTKLYLWDGTSWNQISGSSSGTNWALGGNTSTAGVNSQLGTLSNTSLRLMTNSIQRAIIDSNGNVGIGILNPKYPLTVQSSGTVPASSWISSGTPLFVGYGENAAGSADFNLVAAMASDLSGSRGVFGMKRSRGTLATPTAVNNNDQLGSLLVSGFDGTNFQGSAAVNFYADGTPSSGSVPARISFVTGTNDGNRTERLKVGSSGTVEVVTGLKLPYGTLGNGKVLTSDASGNATWQTPADATDSLIYSTKAYRQKGIDSVVGLIPSLTNYLQKSDSTIYSTKANATKQRDSVVALLSSVAATRLITTVYNNSGSTITKGSVVYINGAHSSNLPTIALAKANNEATSAYTYGLVETDIANNSQGTVIQSGVVTNLNLPTSTYTDGQTLYLSPTVAGGYTLTKPLAPNHYVAIGTITRAHPTLGTIQIAIRNGFQLDEMSDVSIALVPVDSTILQFSRVDSLWHDVDPTTAMGNRFVKRIDSSSMLSPYIRSAGYGLTKSSQSLLADSLLLSTRAWRQKGLDSLARLELSISDTATMLSPYLRKADTVTLSNRINLKQNTISLTTTGSSGAATFSSSTLNVPNYTLSGLGGEPAITAGTTAQYWRGDKTWQTLTTTQSGTYADMIAVSSPTAGQQFFVNDYIPGLYVYSSFTSDWQYQSNIQNVYVNQNFTTQTSVSVFQNFRYTLVTGTMGAGVTGDANAKFGAALVCSSATTTSGTILLQGNSTGYGVHSGSKKHGWIVRLSEADVPTASEDFNVIIGTTNNANGVPLIGFTAHRSYSNNWTAISSTSFNASSGYDVGGSTTYTNTGVAINSGYNEFVVLVDEAIPSVKYYINGTLVATHTTNIPASGAAALLSGGIFRKIAGSTNRSVRFDYLTAYVYKK